MEKLGELVNVEIKGVYLQADLAPTYATVYCSQIDLLVFLHVFGIYETWGDSLYIKRIFLAKYE